MKDNEKIRKNKIIKTLGIITSGIGIVFLFTSVISMVMSGIGNLTTILIGLVLIFVGNTIRLIGKNNLENI